MNGMRFAYPARLLTGCLLLSVASLAAAAAGSCARSTATVTQDVRFDNPQDTPRVLAQLTGQSPNPSARTQISQLVSQAIDANAGMRSARRNRSAAEYDVDEQRGAARPQLGLSGSLTSAYTRVNGQNQPNPSLGSASLTLSAPIYDGGRLSSLNAWREGLLEANKAIETASRESVALEVVTLSLDRERYELQTQVYQRYVAHVECLLESLTQIVKEDRGRASELVQARKALIQAQISVDEAQSRTRQVEFQLTRLLGPEVLGLHGLSAALVDGPQVAAASEFLEHSALLRQLRAEAQSQKSYAESLSREYRPQVSWLVSGATGRSSDGLSSSTSVQAGVTFNASLYSGGANDAGYKAALARTDAAQLRLEQVQTDQMAHVNELKDQIAQGWSRAQRYAQVLNDSELVRRNTQDLWFLLGRRSLFDVMASQGDHYAAQIAFLNTVFDAMSAQAQLRSAGSSLVDWVTQAAPPAKPAGGQP
jgi:outer membrane protein TolC